MLKNILILFVCIFIIDVVISSKTDEEFQAKKSDFSIGRHPNALENPDLSWWGSAPYPARGKVMNELCYYPLDRTTCAPHFVISGSMKCGTTSLFGYLSYHPQVLPLRSGNDPLPDKSQAKTKKALADKEVRFFNGQSFKSSVGKGEGKSNESLQGYYNLYKHIDAVDDLSKQMVTGEATPMYLCAPQVAGYTYSGVPNSKQIFLFRNPAERMWSEYWFNKSLKTKLQGEKDTSQVSQTKTHLTSNNEFLFKESSGNGDTDEFRMCLNAQTRAAENCNYIDWDPYAKFYGGQSDPKLELESLHKCYQEQLSSITKSCSKNGLCSSKCNSMGVRNSLYAQQLAPYYQYFPLDQILVINSNEFYADTAHWMDVITEYLHLQPFDWSEVTHKAFNIMKAGTTSANHAQVKGGGLNMGQLDEKYTHQYPPLDEETKSIIDNWFKPYNQQLANLIGTELWWDEK